MAARSWSRSSACGRNEHASGQTLTASNSKRLADANESPLQLVALDVGLRPAFRRALPTGARMKRLIIAAALLSAGPALAQQHVLTASAPPHQYSGPYRGKLT